MPRRFALALLALLVLLLLGLLAGRKVHESRQKRRVASQPVPTRPIPPPPTPIPARLAAIWFESAADGMFRGEVREVPAVVDDVALLRRLGAEVLAGPRHPDLLRPFPEGWTLRAAYRLADGLAVLDLAPPASPAPPVEEGDGAKPADAGGKKAPTPTPSPVVTEPPKRWETGSSEELAAVQALVLTVTKNLPAVTRVILLVGGEPVETLAGHVDLTHPIPPDLSRAADEAPLVAPMPTSPPDPAASAEPASSPTPVPDAAAPSAQPPPAASPVPPRPAARPSPSPRKSFDRT
ncbi:MAG: hypothetical protein ACYC4P_18390 [Thermoanaerobaculia bacterium]